MNSREISHTQSVLNRVFESISSFLTERFFEATLLQKMGVIIGWLLAFLIQLWKFQKNLQHPFGGIQSAGGIRAIRRTLKLKYKINKSNFSTENPNISQFFPLDKLVSGQGL